MGERQCVNCGRMVDDHLTACPHCREPLAEVPTSYGFTQIVQGGREIRHGLLYMLTAAVFYYFAAGYSPLDFPEFIDRARPALTGYLLPLLFLGGLGQMAYGFYLRVTT